MTVELGNINKGIPMGSYISGEGGGGTAKVTGVDPIAVTNGSIAIKIDEQTLQVNEQGELSANLDEIGSELNDLSGRVTAAEVDILAKENKITAVAPFTLKEEVKSNLKGMVYTTDGTGIYNPAGKGFSGEQGFNSQSDGIRVYGQSYSDYFVKASDISPLGGVLLPSYISIPYRINQIVQMPSTDIFGLGYYCKTLADGSIVPVAQVNSSISDIGGSDACFLTNYSRIICISSKISVSGSSVSVGTPNWTYGKYAQLKEENNVIDQYYLLNNGTVYKHTITNASSINRLKEIDCVVFTPMVSDRDSRIRFGIDASTAFPVNQIGLYEGNLVDMLTAGTEPAVSATNLFNLGGVSSKNYLELSVGDGLAIQDNKLVSTLEIPDSYTKTEANALLDTKASKSDLDKKENKITTTGALTLTEKVISNLNGMSITTDGTGVFSTSGTYIDSGRKSWSDSDRIVGSSGTSGYFVPGEYTADSWRGGYIDMPYTFGYTMKMPQEASYYGYAGKYDVEGRFIPIIEVGYSHNGKSILYSDSLTLEKESGYNYTILRGQASAASGKTTYVSTSGGRNNYGWTISDKSYQYLQWYIESNGTVTQIRRDGQTTDARFYVATSASAAQEAVTRWKEVTVIRFAPTYVYGSATYGVSANPFPAGEFGVYPTDKKIYEYASEADLIATGNLFDLSGQTAHNYLELNIGSGLAITDGKLTASSTTPSNMVTTDTAQTISGEKTFSKTICLDSSGLLFNNDNGWIGFEYWNSKGPAIDFRSASFPTTSNQVAGSIVLKTGVDGSGVYHLAPSGLRRQTNTGDIQATFFDSSNLTAGDNITISGSYDSGYTISATGGSSGSTSVEKYGIEGDYTSKYGILECPNGIFSVSDMTMTLQPGVVMQCAGSETKTTNSSAMAHTVTSTSDFDIFYTSGQFIEAAQVVFSTEEPENGAAGYIAWWDPSRADKQWQFKSNDSGNVWAAAPACRLAHVHTDGTTITRVDYIGNRQMDDGVFVDASTLDGISFKKITQSAYEALAAPDANTLYIIVG